MSQPCFSIGPQVFAQIMAPLIMAPEPGLLGGPKPLEGVEARRGGSGDGGGLSGEAACSELTEMELQPAVEPQLPAILAYGQFPVSALWVVRGRMFWYWSNFSSNFSVISITSSTKRFEAAPKPKSALGELGPVLIVRGPGKSGSSSSGDFGHLEEVEEPAMLPSGADVDAYVRPAVLFVALLAKAFPAADNLVAIFACSSLEFKQKRVMNASSCSKEARNSADSLCICCCRTC